MMKKCLSYLLALAIGIGSIGCTSMEAVAASYNQVASEDEKITPQEVGVEGMEPIYGTNVVDGTYEVEVESSSSMFPIDKAELTVSQGKMTAVLTMGGTGYLKVFMGTGEEAAASDPSAYIDYVENADGKHTYTIPVAALDAPISCAAFSKNKEKWYDRTLLFRADSLPEEAVLVELPDYEALKKAAKEKRIAALKAEKEASENKDASGAEDSQEADSSQEAAEDQESSAEPAFLEMEDGEYAIAVDLEGGTGRTTVTTPAGLIVKDGLAYARIEWSSSHYDYMLVGGEKYLPINEEGYSTFEIPITVFDKPMPVVADTVAMSTPHEIEYSLTFHTDGITSKSQTPQAAAQRVVYMVILIIAVCIIVSFVNKRRRNSGK